MSSEYLVRPFQPGDARQIVQLLKRGFGEWPFFDIDCSPIDHWKWRYLHNPRYQSLVPVVEISDKIVACSHCSLNDVNVYGRKMLGAYNTDHCTDPEHRGKGVSNMVSTLMLEMKKKRGIEFAYMVTVNPIVIKSNARKIHHPYPFPYSVEYLTRIDDIDLHTQKEDVKHETLIRMKKALDRLRGSPAKDSNHKVLSIKVFDNRIEDFLDKAQRGYDFVLKRTQDYLNWRYCDTRGGKYQIRVVEKGGDVVGYVVLRINKISEYHQGYIVDILTLPERIDVARTLLSSSLDYFKENNVNVVNYQVVKDHTYESLFKSYGFYGGQGSRRVFYNTPEGDAPILEHIDPNRMHFPFGDLTGI